MFLLIPTINWIFGLIMMLVGVAFCLIICLIVCYLGKKLYEMYINK